MKHCTPLFLAAVTLASFDFVAQPPSPPMWTVTRNQRIDANRENLTTFYEAAIGPAGEFLIPQPSDERLYLYDTAGRRTATIGRRGEGPGEIQSLTNFGFKGDSIWTADGRTPYYTIFTRQGRYVRQQHVVPPSGRAISDVNPRPEAFSRTSEGMLLLVQLGILASGLDCACVLWAGVNGEVRNVVGNNPPNIDPSIRYTGGSVAVLFGWRTQRDAAPDGSRVAWLYATATDRNQGRYRVVAIGQRGDTLFNRAYAFERVPVPASETEKSIAARTKANPAFPAAEMRSKVPSVYQPYVSQGIYQGIRVGLDNTIWIGLRATSAGNPWLVLDATGNPIGRVVLPLNTRLLEANRTTIWGSEEDADGLMSPVRYAVRG